MSLNQPEKPGRSGPASRRTRGPNQFSQRDLTRAVRATRAAGLTVARVAVDKSGRIEVIVGDPSHNALEPERNDFGDG